MTPEQLERAKKAQDLAEQLRKAISSCQAAVAHGGITRVHAWKAAADNGRKLLVRGCQDPARLSEALRNLRSCEGSDIASMAEMAYGR